MAVKEVDLGNVVGPPGPQGERGHGSNQNLLINWYFLNPINQRKTSGTFSKTGQYFIDRWKLVSGTVTLTENGIILNGTIAQILETAITKTAKASVLTTDGFGTASYDASTNVFSITATSQTLIAAKLELGKEQTLAVQNGSTLVLNDPPPDQTLEQLKCTKCLVRFIGGNYKSGNPGGVFYAKKSPGTTDVLIMFIPLPVKMRVNPTVVMRGELDIGNVEVSLTNAKILLVNTTENGVIIVFSDSTIKSIDNSDDLLPVLVSGNDTSSIELNAEP